MVENLRAAVEERQWPESHRPTLWVATHGIASMAVADCNKKKLGDAGVITELARVIEKADVNTTEGAWAAENASAALWALAFTDENKDRMLKVKHQISSILEGATKPA
eukprot:SAG22_NODE_596_length_8727_cov_107.360338_11_plen_108_part_00